MMKGMVIKKDGARSGSLELREIKMPVIRDNEVMIQVFACGVNRGDVIDLDTKKDGICPGLECSGIIEAVGTSVHRWKVGQRVCAILERGGYAEKVCVLENFLLPLPDDINLYDAASLPYASCCIWLVLSKTLCYPNTDKHQLKNKKILIRQCTSGIGALAIQYAKFMGLTVFAAKGSSNKFSVYCQDSTYSYYDHKSTIFADEIAKYDYLGVDIVLDYDASDLRRNIEYCRTGGKVCIVDLHGMVCNSIDVAMLQKKQGGVKVFDIPSRDLGYKASVIDGVRTHLWPAVLDNKIMPVVENRRFVLTEAQKALKLLKKNDNIGKIIVYMNFEKTSDHIKMN